MDENELFAQMSVPLLRHLRHRFRGLSTEDLEDCVQEAFVRALGDDVFTGMITDPKRRAWLYTTTRRLCVDLIRGRAKETERYADYFILAVADLSGDGDTIDGLDTDEALARLAPLIRKLPPRQREVLQLRVFLGLDSKTTADRLRISEHTVKSHLWKARRKLRAAWQTAMQEPNPPVSPPAPAVRRPPTPARRRPQPAPMKPRRRTRSLPQAHRPAAKTEQPACEPAAATWPKPLGRWADAAIAAVDRYRAPPGVVRLTASERNRIRFGLAAAVTASDGGRSFAQPLLAGLAEYLEISQATLGSAIRGLTQLLATNAEARRTAAGAIAELRQAEIPVSLPDLWISALNFQEGGNV